jgi:hypothetical protein
VFLKNKAGNNLAIRHPVQFGCGQKKSPDSGTTFQTLSIINIVAPLPLGKKIKAKKVKKATNGGRHLYYIYYTQT